MSNKTQTAIFDQHKETIIAYLLDTKKSYRDIADELSNLLNRRITRSAFCGMVHRAKPKLKAEGIAIPERKLFDPSALKDPRGAERRRKMREMGLTARSRIPRSLHYRKASVKNPKPHLAEVAPPDPSKVVYFSDRRPGQCPYPLWGADKKIGNVCGCAVSGKFRTSYCDYHHLICEPGRQ